MIAIILAAGSGRRLSINKPKGLLNVGQHPLIYYSIRNLIKTKKIKDIYIVIGYEFIKYENYFNSFNFDTSVNIKTIKNDLFETSGSMFSLYLALQELIKASENNINQNVIILDSDIIYDYDEFYSYITNSYTNAIFATNVAPERYDACYIKENNDCYLKHISKDINSIGFSEKTTLWEHIGITKTSADSIKAIRDYCEKVFDDSNSFQHEYDNIFENLPSNYKVCKYENYIWTEVDDDLQLNYLITNIYPKLNI
ncbi:NTP transferase domain-containing protein [Chryseobacterium sp. RP-3-3]|uniref:NTP transferase domain-containing protein n=1 Tax=Chryseobacterium antibioticum TaxID=2728847 RepID=A0A7Y0AQ81_9FLAO|nr:NTP transferase domain-containing protein [Chryseobacterium antibioticum]NML71484.1 NTP transferase domain-containing protein [Chryseobacterium antibioticum]